MAPSGSSDHGAGRNHSERKRFDGAGCGGNGPGSLPSSLKHSLTGPSAVQDNRGDGGGDGNESPYIPNH
jgi:hypothetical protein